MYTYVACIVDSSLGHTCALGKQKEISTVSNNGGNEWQYLMLEQKSDNWWEYYDRKTFLP